MYIYACVRAFGEEWIVTCALVSIVQPLGESVLSILTHKIKIKILNIKTRHNFPRVHDIIGNVSAERCKRGLARRHPPIVCLTREGRDRYVWMGLCFL